MSDFPAVPSPGSAPSDDPAMPGDADLGAGPGDGLAEATQNPTFDVPDDKLSEYGLDSAQPGDKVTFTVMATIASKTPGGGPEAGSMGISSGPSESAPSAGSTTLSIDSITDVKDGNSEIASPDVAAPAPAGGLGFTPKKKPAAISPKDAGFPTSKKD